MSLFLEETPNFSDIVKYLGCKPLNFLNYMKEFDVLIKQGYLIKFTKNGPTPSFLVPSSVIRNLEQNILPLVTPIVLETDYDLFAYIDEILNNKDDLFETSDDLHAAIYDLLKQNENLSFVKKLKDFSLDYELYVFVYMCVEVAILGYYYYRVREFSDMLSHKDFSKLENDLAKNEARLSKAGLIRRENDDEFCKLNRDYSYSLTETAFKIFLPEYFRKNSNLNKYKKNFIAYEKLSRNL